MRALDGNATLPYLEMLIQHWLRARARLRKVLVMWEGGRGGSSWFNGGGVNRAKVGRSCKAAWHGCSRSHVRGRLSIGPGLSLVGFFRRSRVANRKVGSRVVVGGNPPAAVYHGV